MVDIEALLSQFLRAQPEVTAIVADRVYTDLPHDRVYPLVLITRIGGAHSINRPLWLDDAMVQLDVFGGTHRQAYQLMNVTFAVIGARLIGQHAEGCVTNVTSDSIAYNPEDDFIDERGHARPRYTASVIVTTHPVTQPI